MGSGVIFRGHSDHAPLTIATGLTLLAVSVFAILTFSIQQDQTATLLFAYAGGMAMLLTPCRFPVVLAIVPLCRRGSPARGVALALVFAAGLTITQTLWGVAIAVVGQMFGLREVARYLSLAGGGVAYLFGLSVIGLISLPLPSGASWMPSGVRTRSEFLGAFVMGLLLGNAGMCCPDPVFLTMTPFIAAKGSLGQGAALAFAYGLGRATPLVAIVMLARGGVDALQLAVRHKQRFNNALGWGLLAIGTFAVYGYSGVSHDRLLATTMMTAPVLAYHLKLGTALPRTAAWVAVTAVSTLLGVRAMYWMLVNLP
jgi:cytochrome c-type biogenesis protein